jgi:hypothetical protein
MWYLITRAKNSRGKEHTYTYDGDTWVVEPWWKARLFTHAELPGTLFMPAGGHVVLDRKAKAPYYHIPMGERVNIVADYDPARIKALLEDENE